MAKTSFESSRYETQPELSEKDIESLLDDYADALEHNVNETLRDEDIDLSDHPEWTENMLRAAVRGTFYRPSRDRGIPRLDADVIAWFRHRYPADENAMNAVLRAYMDAHADGEVDDEALRKTA